MPGSVGTTYYVFLHQMYWSLEIVPVPISNIKILKSLLSGGEERIFFWTYQTGTGIIGKERIEEYRDKRTTLLFRGKAKQIFLSAIRFFALNAFFRSFVFRCDLPASKYIYLKVLKYHRRNFVLLYRLIGEEFENFGITVSYGSSQWIDSRFFAAWSCWSSCGNKAVGQLSPLTKVRATLFFCFVFLTHQTTSDQSSSILAVIEGKYKGLQSTGSWEKKWLLVKKIIFL